MLVAMIKWHSLYKTVEIPIQMWVLDIIGFGDLPCNLNFPVADLISPQIEIIPVILLINKSSDRSLSKCASMFGEAQGL